MVMGMEANNGASGSSPSGRWSSLRASLSGRARIPRSFSKSVAIGFPGRRLRELAEDFDPPRILVPAQPRLDELLNLARELRIAPLRDDEGFRHEPAPLIGDADDGRFPHVGVLEQHLLDLHRAHRESR